jgi:hypothetical protein
VRFEVLTAPLLQVQDLWDMTLSHWARPVVADVVKALRPLEMPKTSITLQKTKTFKILIMLHLRETENEDRTWILKIASDLVQC